MKTIKNLQRCVLLLIFYSIGLTLVGQETLSSMQAWKDISQKEFVADFFSDMFVNLGISVVESGEKFTVHYTGKVFELKPGIVESEVELILPVRLKNIKDLIEHVSDGVIDEHETFRILSVLFTPLTAKTLKNPDMIKNTSKWMKFAKNHIHVYLLDPKKERIVGHTLIFLNGEWIVIPGIYGKAKVTYKMTPKQALDYQKKVYSVLKANSKKEWKEFKKWYMDWSKKMAVNK